jgi:hypothetical protein
MNGLSDSFSFISVHWDILSRIAEIWSPVCKRGERSFVPTRKTEEPLTAMSIPLYIQEVSTHSMMNAAVAKELQCTSSSPR